MVCSIQYYTALVQLFQPMLHLVQINRQDYGQLQRLVVEYAQVGLRLLYEYEIRYSIFYLSALQLLCLVQLCDAVIRYDGAGDTSLHIIRFCFRALNDAKSSYPVAGPLAQMFRSSLKEYNLDIPDDLRSLIDGMGSYSPDELLNTCTRVTYRQPIAQILANMQEDTAEEFIRDWQRQLSQGILSGARSRANSALSSGGKRVDIDSLLNQ